MYSDKLKYCNRNRGTMNIKQLQYVSKVAQLQSFTKAAKKLKISQPTLSRNILNLEKDIGISIFDRSKFPLLPTKNGKNYIQKIDKILQLYDELSSNVLYLAGKVPQKLRVGLNQTGYTYLLQALSKFEKLFEDVDLKLTQADSTNYLKKMLLDDEIDIATLTLPIDKNIFSYKIITKDTIKLALPISVAQKFKNRKSISLKVLKNEKFILPLANQKSRMIYDNLFKKAGYEPKIIAETEGFMIANYMVANGLGISFTLEKYIINDIKDNIKLLDINDRTLSKVLAIAYKKNKKPNKIAREFIKIAKETLTSQNLQ